MGRHNSLRYVGGGGSVVGGRIRDGGRETRSEAGAAKRTMALTKMTAARASRRQNESEVSQVSSNRAGGKYRAEGTNQEESEDESAEWSSKETEGSVTE